MKFQVTVPKFQLRLPRRVGVVLGPDATEADKEAAKALLMKRLGARMATSLREAGLEQEAVRIEKKYGVVK